MNIDGGGVKGGRGRGIPEEKEVGELPEPLSGGTAEVKEGKGYTREKRGRRVT